MGCGTSARADAPDATFLASSVTRSDSMGAMRRSHLIALVTILTAALASTASSQTYQWREVVQTVTIEPDGAVVVDDTRTLWTNGDFGEAFICVQHGAGQRLTLLEGSGAVSPGPSATAFTQACEDGTPGTEMVVRNSERVSVRRFRYLYRLEGTVDAYTDVVQWYWNPLERNHPGVAGYDLTVRAPGSMEAPYDAYVHRYANPERPRVTLSDDRATLHVQFDRIPSGNGVEIRYLMDPALFTLNGTLPMFEELLRDEAQIARVNVPESPDLRVPNRLETGSDHVTITGTASDPDGIAAVRWVADGARGSCSGTTNFRCEVGPIPVGDTYVDVVAEDGTGYQRTWTVWVKRLSWFDRLRGSHAWALAAFAIVGWFGRKVWGDYQRYGREPPSDGMKYPFEPPSDLPPAAVTTILDQSYQQGRMGAAFHATIMDLARRGFGEFEPKGRKFQMRLHPEKSKAGLLPFEASVLGYLEAAAKTHRRGDPEFLEFRELKSYSERNASSFMRRWGPSVRKWLEAQRGGDLTDPQSRKAANRAAGVGLLAAAGNVAGLVLTTGAASGWFVGGIVASVALIVTALVAIPAWRPDVAAEVYGWQGFKRTLTDYTRMKDAPLDFFGLWDVYYCYAAAMGVAEKYLRALKRAAPLAGVDERTMVHRAHWMGSAGSVSDLAGLSSSISSLSSALSSASASASSGGSSSGGGGGGGGGGSSGGR